MTHIPIVNLSKKSGFFLCRFPSSRAGGRDGLARKRHHFQGCTVAGGNSPIVKGRAQRGRTGVPAAGGGLPRQSSSARGARRGSILSRRERGLGLSAGRRAARGARGGRAAAGARWRDPRATRLPRSPDTGRSGSGAHWPQKATFIRAWGGAWGWRTS